MTYHGSAIAVLHSTMAVILWLSETGEFQPYWCRHYKIHLFFVSIEEF